MKDVLLLNADHTPLTVLPWQRAVRLVLADRVDRLVDYPDVQVHSVGRTVPVPAVITLRTFIRAALGLPFSRSHVLARDGWTCQYCGAAPTRSDGRPDTAALTLDHVVPRARSKGGKVTLADGRVVAVTSWANVVACCRPCNGRKGDRSPREVGMTLRSAPRAPGPADRVRIAFARMTIPPEWRDWLPET